ncbi:MAG: mechanosensitive ion channel [Blastomonas sp.]|jgi:small-conductance mechanosensitive channel|uniref:mechanosensitive ion channel family protein n=1 Tax=Blastomonas sp. TaxID=1909299 RepID=UPI002587DB0D|nr:mechanosensitive ion channel domain-containing protein [Blastomonas sp.]MCO5794207.1 mechanosensitive ion channel [Blastomonas sp.]
MNEAITTAFLRWGWIRRPDDLQYVEGVLAALIATTALIVGWGLSRLVYLRLAAIWERRAGYESPLARRRIRDMVRRFTTAMLIGMALNLNDWSLIASVVFGLTLAISLALFVNDLVRGVRMPDWLGTFLGLATLVSILASMFGGLDPITIAMDRVGFNLGQKRFSLLWVVTIAVTVLVLYTAARVVNRIAGHIIGSSDGLDPTQKLLGQKIAGVVVIVIAFFIGIDALGIDLTALSFFSGAFGLAIGFGLQKTIGNLFAGIILLLDRSIKPGDVIAVGDSFGWVNKIGVRAVSVITRDGKEHLIPNEDLMTTAVENWSYSDRNVRMRIPVGVAYTSDMQLVQELLYRAVDESPRVLKDPVPRIWMTDFGDNSVNWEIRAWISDPEGGMGNIRGDVLMRVWNLFQEHAIEIPFPQRDLYIKELPGMGGAPTAVPHPGEAG